MTDTVLNQILNQLQALQASQQALQAKVRRTIDTSGISAGGLIECGWLLSLIGRQSCHHPYCSRLSRLRV